MARRRETARHALSRASLFPVILLKKARWGKDGGPGGKETSLCASRDRMAAAGRARCDEGSYGHRQQR